MKLLFVHADYFNYQVREETGLAEKISDPQRKGSIGTSLIVFLSVEEEDEKSEIGSDKLAEEALDEIKAVISKIKVRNVVLFPFAHLSETLASPGYALSVMERLESGAKKSELDTLRVPFGWYKEFEFKSKGHPLSVLSRTVRP